MRMTPGLYRVARALAHEHRSPAVGHPHHLTATGLRTMPVNRAAVYIIVDAGDHIVYVGSVARGRPDAIVARLTEHLRERGKARIWRRVWVIPLREDTPSTVVRAIEGRVALRVGLTDTAHPAADRPKVARGRRRGYPASKD